MGRPKLGQGQPKGLARPSAPKGGGQSATANSVGAAPKVAGPGGAQSGGKSTGGPATVTRPGNKGA